MIRKYLRNRARPWLQKRGFVVRQVNYRVDVPQKPLEVQPVLLERMGIERPVIFDIGANKGKITAEYRQLFPQAEIYSFEPFPELYDGLREQFGEDDHIHVVPLAVSGRVGAADFHLTSFHATNSLLPREETGRRYYPRIALSTGETIKVETTTLDAFCAGWGIERVDIIKFDIQGGEMMALQGAADVLRNRSVKLIFTESALIQHYEGEALLHEVTALLAGYGFSLYDLYHLFRGRNGQLRYCEALFVSQALREAALDTFPEEP